ncbi:3D domain-containing protein [Paenibacillus sp. 1P03SA]|uniref:3D domain-containing protein n=1 Tax=Paenibacillus sp. 1P03SA TaxID=3132294 RepID=UPI0039A2BFED
MGDLVTVGTTSPQLAANAQPENVTSGPKPQATKKPSGKSTVRREVYNVTAYSLGDSSTPTHGVTASGERVQEGRTIACPRELPFGTEIYIPYLDNTYVCTDRGGAITAGHLDVYFERLSDTRKFGRRWLEVEVRRK